MPRPFGYKCSAETIEKMRAASTGRTIGPEARAKIAASNRGRKLSAETRAKMSAARMGKTQSAAAREKLSLASKAWWAARRGEPKPKPQEPAKPHRDPWAEAIFGTRAA